MTARKKRDPPSEETLAGAEELSRQWARLAHKIALRYARAYPAWAEEAHAEAVVALWQAALDFDPAEGVPFNKWASLVIGHAMARWDRYQHRRRGCRPLTDVRGECGPEAVAGNPVDRREREPPLAAEVSDLLAVLRERLGHEDYYLLWSFYACRRKSTELGPALGVSKQRAHQKIQRALRRARAALGEEVLTP